MCKGRADDLAVAVWSVAGLGFVPSRAWLAAAGARVQQVLPGCSVACRQQLLRALAQVQARCEAAWQGLLLWPGLSACLPAVAIKCNNMPHCSDGPRTCAHTWGRAQPPSPAQLG